MNDYVNHSGFTPISSKSFTVRPYCDLLAAYGAVISDFIFVLGRFITSLKALVPYFLLCLVQLSHEPAVNVFVDTGRSLDVDVEAIRLCKYRINLCTSCRLCMKKSECVIDDDMVKIYPKLLESDGILMASPVYFNNVSAQAFMDRTCCLRGRLKWIVGGAIVVCRRYGHESALNAIHSFFLKHEIILAYRGAVAFFERRDNKR